VTKRLSEYHLNQWIEAAGECPQCLSRHLQVMITWVDETGDCGDIVVRCLVCGFTDCDVAGWTVDSCTRNILGKPYTPIKLRTNVGPCVACERLVVGVPLILFIDEGRGGELDFCSSCFEKVGLLETLK
jgi:hypothetical protein